MDLRWLTHLANHVLGSSNKEIKVQTNHDFGNLESSKDQLVMSEMDKNKRETHTSGFQMPLHYPRYKKGDYEKMEEWRIDLLLREYGLIDFKGSFEEKRKFAMGAFLWPDQY